MPIAPFSLESYTYYLPKELIAQHPIEPRDQARLLVVERKCGTVREGRVSDLPDILSPGDALVFNNTKVLHAMLKGHLESGRGVECLLTESESPYSWWALTKPSKLFSEGRSISFAEGIEAVVIKARERGERLLRFSQEITPSLLQKIGTIPLPPYIRRAVDKEVDSKRYQTVYAEHFGSVAAPTAGLHFTDRLLSSLDRKGIERHQVTLHVGTGTFVPIRTDDIRDHQMHTEQFEVDDKAACALNQVSPSRRKVAVGTTSCRVLESIVQKNRRIEPQSGRTNLYITPGYEFTFVDTLFTNFHTPGSSLLVLVSAFMGYDLMKEAYAKAIEKRFRFFSYGDAMVIL